MKLIAFTGQMGSGKSTAVSCVKNILEGTHVHANVKFAQPLYDIQDYVYDRIASVHVREEGFIKDRKLLQFLGTEWGRNTIKESLWIDLWKNSVNWREKVKPCPLILTCDDVRFDNEAAAVKELGGMVVKIISNKDNNNKVVGTGSSSHESERGVSDKYIDFILENNGSVEDLKQNLCTILEYSTR